MSARNTSNHKGLGVSKFQPQRGTRDLLPDEQRKHQYIIDTARHITRRFGFEQIETPIFESTEVFARGLGEATDVVSKEMYTFPSRDGSASLTLRPENTAGVVRSFVSNGLSNQAPVKHYYAGPMFRYERPQKGRYRQFHQIGVELIGQGQPQADIETIAAGNMVLAELGLIDKVTLEINTLGDTASRQAYREALVAYFSDFFDKLSAESQERLSKNPLRILDSKSESDQVLVADAPKFEAYLNAESQDFYAEVKAGLEALGIAYRHNPLLVRGLDYYCHTAFEFTTTHLGAQSGVLGGGRYDGLVEMLGGAPTPGVGWAGGIERMALLLDHEPAQLETVAIVPLGADCQTPALVLAQELRQAGLVVDQSYSGNLKKRLTRANKAGARYAVLLGSDELAQGQVALRDMQDGGQVALARDAIADHLLSLVTRL
jgi:histidyl-tRNA synthetase